MTFSVCIDIGGTFTDCVVLDPHGQIHVFKTPSTPRAFEKGFMDVLKLAAKGFGLHIGDFLANVELIVHGTTVSTNALVMGNAARVGLITNKGFPDILLLREGPRKGSFAWRLDYPDPFVARNMTCEVRGRIDARGDEVEELEPDDVLEAVAHLKKMDVQTVAVCFLWSIVNPKHELLAKELLVEAMPGIPVVLSHEINPIPREYRRAISTCIDAALHPVVSSYIETLARSLDTAQFKGELLIADCAGGMMPPNDIARSPIYSVMSGPTLAPIAALDLSTETDVIVIDMGGTTFDVSGIRDRRIVVTNEAMVGNDLLGIPKVDVRSVGAGGGSIAWVDSGGLLRVGPQSAGALPGPACYGAGGEEPTVTDANVVLGIIDPDYFLGGRIVLDRTAAEKAIGGIADKLGIAPLEAAYAIHTTSNHNMVAAIQDITINEGIDPRDSYLVSGGGATGCHVAEIASVLDLKRFMVPKVAAALSAYGGLVSDIHFEFKSTSQTNSQDFHFDAINTLLNTLKTRGEESLKSAGVHPDLWSFEFVCSGRYEFQSWEIEVPFELPSGGFDEAALAALTSAFHEMHDRIYAIKDEEEVVEFITWRVTSIGKREARVHDRSRDDATGRSKSLVVKGERPVYLQADGGLRKLPIYDGNTVHPGAIMHGPSIVEEQTTTIFLLPGMVAKVDDNGNYNVKIEG